MTEFFYHGGRLYVVRDGVIFEAQKLEGGDEPAPSERKLLGTHRGEPYYEPKALEKPKGKRTYKKRTVLVPPKAPSKPKTRDEIEAFQATVREVGIDLAAKGYGVSDQTIRNWANSLGVSVTKKMSGTEVASSGGNMPLPFKCSVECGQENWLSRGKLGEVLCPKCNTRAIPAP